MALLPTLVDAFARVSATLEGFKGTHKREVLSVGAVGTFAVGWLLPRLRDFQARHPFVELRLFTHNNRIDLAAEGLDCAIRFGDGQWPGMQTRHLLAAPLAPVCAPSLANRIRAVADLGRETLLRSYRSDEWLQWFDAAGGRAPLLTGPMFDSSLVLADAAAQGAGVALLPLALFGRDLQSGRLARLFDTEVDVGSYWLTRVKTRRRSTAMKAFQDWLEQQTPEAPAT
jgi:LysR family transcriptional regulator, regulator of gene expression of beta-lactamase